MQKLMPNAEIYRNELFTLLPPDAFLTERRTTQVQWEGCLELGYRATTENPPLSRLLQFIPCVITKKKNSYFLFEMVCKK